MNVISSLSAAACLSVRQMAALGLVTLTGWASPLDDHGNTPETASYLPATTEWTADGVIDGVGDLDVLAFSTGGGAVSVRVAAGGLEGVDRVQAELLDLHGITLASVEATVTGSSLDLELAAGRYFLRMQGAEGTRYGVSGRVPAPTSGVPPVAVISNLEYTGVAPFRVHLDGGRSFDLDGAIRSMTWDFSDGTGGQGAAVMKLYSAPGTYAATLTVTDDEGLSHSEVARIRVLSPAQVSALGSASGVLEEDESAAEAKVRPPNCNPLPRRCLRVIESTLPVALSEALAQHEADLKAEGWKVETIYTSRRDPVKLFQHVELAQREIWPRVRANTNLHVFFIGKLPMPRSGYASNPDGHTDTRGAYACTAYYAMPSDGWTDVLDNTGIAMRPAMINGPGDGKFDQDTAPGNRDEFGNELGGDALASVGFLDLSFGAPRTFGSTLSTEEFLIDRYLRYFAQLHRYRTGEWRPKTPVAHMAYDGRPWSDVETWATRTVGTSSYRFFRSYSTSKTQSFTVEQSASFGLVLDFKVTPSTGTVWTSRSKEWAVFDLYYGSYQVDFGSPRLVNPLLSGALATGCFTWNRWNLDGLFEGATLGEVWRQSVSRSPGNVFRVLYGDPTLVMRR
jgi:chitodextrinase